MLLFWWLFLAVLVVTDAAKKCEDIDKALKSGPADIEKHPMMKKEDGDKSIAKDGNVFIAYKEGALTCFNPKEYCRSKKFPNVRLSENARLENGGCKDDGGCKQNEQCYASLCCPKDFEKSDLDELRCPDPFTWEDDLDDFTITCTVDGSETNKDKKCHGGFCMDLFQPGKTTKNGAVWPASFAKQCCKVKESICPHDEHPIRGSDGKFIDGQCEYSFEVTHGGKKYCCPYFKHTLKGDKYVTLTDPESPQTCTNSCKEGEFCGDSVRIIDGVKATHKYCYEIPKCTTTTFAWMKGSDVVGCLTSQDCFVKDEDPRDCDAGGFCCSVNCPYHTKAQKSYESKACGADSKCDDGRLCMNLGNYKTCCPVDDEFMCPLGQMPVLDANLGKPSNCPDGTEKIKDVCCHKYESKEFKGISPQNPGKGCTTHKDCDAKTEFCGESQFIKDVALMKGAPKHCYPRPTGQKTGGAAALKKDSGVKQCKNDKDCSNDMVSFCEAIQINNKPYQETACIEAKCPLWPAGEKLTVKTADCTAKPKCSKSQQCVSLFQKQKYCCPVHDKFMCSSGTLPALENGELMTKCDGNYEKKTENGIDICCQIIVSKDYADVGKMDVKPLDYKRKCIKQEDCNNKGEFCGKSAWIGDTKIDIGVNFCYEEPKGKGGLPKIGFVACEKHNQCGGGYCNKALGFNTGICHAAICPLTTDHQHHDAECSGNEDCLDGHCHDVGETAKVCCDIDKENLCPGDIRPVKFGDGISCEANQFTFTLKKAQTTACCEALISKTLNDAGTAWLLTKKLSEYSDEITKRSCPNGNECGNGFFCDDSVTMEGTSADLKLCYEVPKSHGEAVLGPQQSLTTCTAHAGCEDTKGELCDTKISLLDTEIAQTTGICAQFVCPLMSSVSALTDCAANGKCAGGLECHPVGKDGHFKACCDAEKQYLCPGEVMPSKVRGKLHGSDPFKCDDKKDFLFDNAGIQRCCPKMISREFFVNSKDIVEPSTDAQKTICKNHGECKNSEFCGESTLKGADKELRVKGKAVFQCYLIPKCAGTAVRNKDQGLKMCKDAKTACGDDVICQKDLGPLNGGKFGNSAVCCEFKCKGTTPESKTGVAGKSNRLCSGCTGNEKLHTQKYCDGSNKNSDKEIEVCEATGVESTYRHCRYERDPVKCPNGMGKPIRSKNTHELISCAEDFDCRKTGEVSACGATSRPIDGAPKICCTADLCPDSWTDRKAEKECSKEAECHQFGRQNGKCEADPLGVDTKTHCCPSIVSPADRTVLEPYRLAKKCTQLEDCIGERRFCDPLTGQCMYHGTNNMRTIDVSMKATCTAKDMICNNDKRMICMKVDMEPTCYQHPLDECKENAACGQTKYCAPEEGTKDEDFDKAFRKCHTLPAGAVSEGSVFGLTTCKKDEDCKQADLVCSRDKAMVKSGFGFCRSKVKLSCHGTLKAQLDSKGEVVGCEKNTDCKSDEFCDMDIERPSSMGKEKGICCSKPTDCGGELPARDVGIKMCSDGCDEAAGEICRIDINKPAASRWKSDQGVCCKMTCPKISSGEVSGAGIAGGICVANDANCKNTTENIMSCVETTGAPTPYSRCCSYKRKTDLCPADSKGVIREGLDAKSCASTSECPKGALCQGGWCCEQSMCPDGKTPSQKQKKCTPETAGKACGQPSGAEASCESGHCCPMMHGKDVQKPFMTAIDCKTVNDCPLPEMYCHAKQNKCVYFGSSTDLRKETECDKKNNKTCTSDGAEGVCVFRDEKRDKAPQCWLDPLAQKSEAAGASTSASEEEESGSSKAGMAVGIVAVILIVVGAAGVGGWFYHKKTAEKRKKKKEAKEKEEKEAKEKEAKEKAPKEQKSKSGKDKKEAKEKEKDVEQGKEANKENNNETGGGGADSTGGEGGIGGGPQFITL